MADIMDSEVTILIFNIHNEPEDTTMHRMQPILKHLGNINWNVHITYNTDVSATILEESQKHDLLILGASNEGLLNQMLFGRIPERIASKCEKTVILVKKNITIPSFIKRWLSRR